MRASIAEAEAAEAGLPVDEIVERAVAEVVVERLSFPPKRTVALSAE